MIRAHGGRAECCLSWNIYNWLAISSTLINQSSQFFVDNKVVLLITVCKYHFSPSHFVFKTQYGRKDTISGVRVSPDSAETLVRRGGIANYHLIAYSLINISAKNNSNWLICVEVIVCYISVVFFETQCILQQA